MLAQFHFHNAVEFGLPKTLSKSDICKTIFFNFFFFNFFLHTSPVHSRTNLSGLKVRLSDKLACQLVTCQAEQPWTLDTKCSCTHLGLTRTSQSPLVHASEQKGCLLPKGGKGRAHGNRSSPVLLTVIQHSKREQ